MAAQAAGWQRRARLCHVALGRQANVCPGADTPTLRHGQRRQRRGIRRWLTRRAAPLAAVPPLHRRIRSTPLHRRIAEALSGRAAGAERPAPRKERRGEEEAEGLLWTWRASLDGRAIRTDGAEGRLPRACLEYSRVASGGAERLGAAEETSARVHEVWAVQTCARVECRRPRPRRTPLVLA